MRSSESCCVLMWCGCWGVWDDRWCRCTPLFGGKPNQTKPLKNKQRFNKGTPNPHFQIPSLQPSCSHHLPIPTFYPKCHLNRFRLTRQLDDFGGWNGLFGSVCFWIHPLTLRFVRCMWCGVDLSQIFIFFWIGHFWGGHSICLID